MLLTGCFFLRIFHLVFSGYDPIDRDVRWMRRQRMRGHPYGSPGYKEPAHSSDWEWLLDIIGAA